MQLLGPVKSFGTRPLGRIILLAVAVLIVGAGFIYLGLLPSILLILVFGLAVPIYTGWKRLRSLALAGLVILLLSGALASALYTQELRTPAPAASSSVGGAFGVGGPVLDNATVSPYVIDTPQNFSFRAALHPGNLPNTSGKIYAVVLFVTTCPYDTTNTSQFCGAGLTSYTQVIRFPNGSPPAQTEVFSQFLGGPNVYWFQMYAVAKSFVGTPPPNPDANVTCGVGTPSTFNNTTTTCILLEPSTGFATIEGPVVGDFLAIWGLVLGSIYVTVFFYLGLPFYIGLLGYAFFKSRQQRRQAQSGAPTPASALPASKEGGPSAPTHSTPPAAEEKCPKCGAIVYASESNCWKCGTPLHGKGPDSPLPSGAPGGPSGPDAP